jgi:hypothetical protein
MKNRCLAELVLFLAIAPGISNAETIYSTFLSGKTYQCCAGQIVSGPSATTAGGLIGQRQTAVAFTPTRNYILTQIELAFYFGNGPNSNRFNLSLNQDRDGVPGAVIESWGGLIAPSPSPGTSSIVQTVVSLPDIQLSAGRQYWIVAFPAESNTFVVWNLNALDGSGPGGRVAENLNSVWSVYDLPRDSPAFEVQGSAKYPVTSYFPQVTVGGGYSTLFTVTNTGSTRASGSLILTDPQGNPLSMYGTITDSSGITGPASAGDSFPITVPAGGTVFLLAAGLSADSATKTGWGQLESTGGFLTGVATYEYMLDSKIQTMVGVLQSQTLQYATIPVDNDSSQGKQTAYAIANPSGQTIAIKLALVGQDGVVVDDTVTVTLGPGEQIARYLWQETARTNFKGSLVLRGQEGAGFIAVALLDKQGLLTAIPLIAGKASSVPD